MTKTTIILLFLLLGGFLNAQVAFYLRPTVNMKTNQGFFGRAVGPKSHYAIVPNKYFSFVNNEMYFDDGNINLGIHIGIRLKSKHFFELGYSGDNSGIETNVLANQQTTNPLTGQEYKYNNATSIQFGAPYTRLSFSYNYLLWKNKAKTIQVRGIAGLGILHNRYVNPKKGDFNEEILYLSNFGEIEPNIFINEHYLVGQQNWRNSPYLNVGLGFDFYTRKQSYLFSFDIFYLQGTKSIQANDHHIKVIDHNKEVNYIYSLASKGSGFYFTLSRRFQVYPWIPLSKKKREVKSL